MKIVQNLSKLFLVLLIGIAFLMPSKTTAQSTFSRQLTPVILPSHVYLKMEALVDSTGDTLTTKTIDMSLGIDNMPLFGKVLFSSTKGKPRIKMVRQEKLFGTWTDVKTLYNADSLETVRATAADTIRAKETRYLILGTSGNRSDTQLKLEWLYKKVR